MRNFTQDKVNPILNSFSLDINIGVLNLTFSETINATSVDFTQLTLQHTSSYPLLTYTLTTGLVISDNDPLLTLILNPTDLNLIKTIDELADTNYNALLNTYLAITTRAIRDMNGNYNNELRSDIGALGVSAVIPDTTRPTLINASLDLNVGMMSLTFDETVREETIDMTEITLLSSIFNNTSTIRLVLFYNKSINLCVYFYSYLFKLSIDIPYKSYCIHSLVAIILIFKSSLLLYKLSSLYRNIFW